MTKIILASRSPRRKELLEKAGLRVRVLPSTIKETKKDCPSLEHYAIYLALLKAQNVASNLKDALVIAADTIVVYKNKLFGKPKNKPDAARILSTLSGTKHYVYTAIAVIDLKRKKRFVDIDKTIIYAKKLGKEQIKNLSSLNHDKAGAYAVQENSDLLVKKIDGDFYNVVGLPLGKLKNILKNCSINLKGFKN